MDQNMNETQEKSLVKGGLLQPKNDVVFQELFTRGKENITKALLEDILKMKIHSLELDKSKDLLNDNKSDKNGRVDLRAVINNNIECDIEMQLATHDKIIERFLYYWAKIYSANLQVGNKYRELRRTISIIIMEEELPQLKGIKKAHTKWQIREEKFQQIILTNYLELHIINMKRAVEEYKNNKQDEVLQWMLFLENPEMEEVKKIMEENEDIKEASEALNEISMDEALRRRALDAEIARMDYEQRMEDAENRRNKSRFSCRKRRGSKRSKIRRCKENVS